MTADRLSTIPPEFVSKEMLDVYIESFKQRLDSQEKFLEERLASQKELISLHVGDAERALVLAKDIADGQREASNYVRDQLREQEATFATKTVFSATTDAIDQRSDRLMERCVSLEKANANIQGRIWALGVGLSLFFSIVQFLIWIVKK